MGIKRILFCVGRALKKTIVDHDGVEHAGYLSFLALLGIFPFLVLLVVLAGLVGNSTAGADFVRLAFTYLPPEMVAALRPRIDEIVSGPPDGLKTLAIIGATWTASSGVEGMRTILNRAYHVPSPPAYPFRRLMSILQFLVMTAIILFAMFLLVPLPLAWQKFESALGIGELIAPVWTYLRLGISALLLFGMVSALYYVIPNIRQRWRMVMPGAAVVVALWMLAASGLATYLSSFRQVSIIYGSLQGIIASLLFFYLISLIFIFGAELNYQLEKTSGHLPPPKQSTTPRRRATDD